MPIKAGTIVGRYEIRSQLGAGGMGEVYLAHDNRLGRTVALKVLAEAVASDQKRMHRFIQEARAASALNHPNIITIHEIEELNGTHFITTELVDGETLRQRLSQEPLSLSEVFEIAIQIASALVAAHEAGIVHRDIKPDNVMLRRDGIVKVLDFGLAKLAEKPSVDTEAATRALVQTEPGTVMGTANYMSPEQARGREVDARTDIWSLGVVIYELIAGRAPFAGETSTDVIASIVKSDPKPLSTYVPDVPDRLEEIVSKTLEKDREDRYQTVKDLLVDLRRLRKRLDFEFELERTTPPDENASSSTISGQQATLAMRAHSTAERSTIPESRPTTSAEYIVSEIKRHKSVALLVLLVVAVAGGGIAWAVYRFAGKPEPTKPASEMKITRLITGIQGRPGNVSISPDGKYVAYSLQSQGQASLWVRQVSQDTSLQIVAPKENIEYSGTSFSPDGELIYFVSTNLDVETRSSLYQVPVLGGREPKKVLDHVSGRVSFSPDGKQIAFNRYFETNDEASVMIANSDGSGGPRKISTRSKTGWYQFGSTTWSPDGKRVAVGAASVPGGLSYTIVEVPVEGGPEKPLTTRTWLDGLSNVSWLPDGSGLVFTARDKGSSSTQLWYVSYPSGEARRVTNDLNTYGSFGVTSSSDTIVVTMSDPTAHIWVVGAGEDESKARRITNGKLDGNSGLDWTPDGRIVFPALTGDNEDLWIMNADGTGPTQLTSDSFEDNNPRVSPDGTFVVFVSNRPDSVPHIWRVNLDGSNLKQLTHTEDYEPTVSPDSRWIAFGSWRTGNENLYRIPADGGDATLLSSLRMANPDYSPDGKQIVLFYYDEKISPPRFRPGILSVEDNQLVKSLDAPLTADAYFWHPTGREFVYSDDRKDVRNLWSVPVEGGTPKQLTKFTSEQGGGFALSRDGKKLAVSRRTVINEIVLIKGFR